MTTEDKAICSAAALIMLQFLFALALKKMNPQNPLTKLLSVVASQLPLTFAHASPSLPQAMASHAAKAKEKATPEALAGAAAKVAGVMVFAFACVFLSGCAGGMPSVQTVTSIGLDVEQVACIIAADELGAKEPAALATACSIPPGEIQSIINLLTATKSARAMAAAKAAAGVK